MFKFLLLFVLSLYMVLPPPASAIALEKPLGFAPKKSSSELVVYFHTLSGEKHEPYLQPIKGAAITDAIKSSIPGAGFLSLDYDPKQVIAGDFSSINETLEAYKRDFPAVASIRLCGISFGGYVALSYLASASNEIKPLIKGAVVACVPDDLDILAKSSTDKDVRNLLSKEWLASKKSTYLKERSLSNIYKSVKKPTPIFFILMKKDTIVPAACNKDLISNLQAKGCLVDVEKIDDGHCFPNIYFFEHGFHFISEHTLH